MKPGPILFCICSLGLIGMAAAYWFQGPSGEVIKRPPPAPAVDERAVARAEAAARARRNAAVADQVELLLKRANENVDKAYPWTPATAQRLSDAEADYQRAAKLKPGDWRVYAGLGGLHMVKNSFAEAALAYQKAITLKPGDAALYFHLGEACGRAYKRTEQIRALEHSVLLDPSGKNNLAYSSLASAYEEVNSSDKAIVTYKRLIAAVSRNPKGVSDPRLVLADTRQSLARVYGRLNRFSEAIAEYKEVSRLKHDANSYFRLGEAYAESKRYPEAIEAFKQAKALDDPNRTRADINLGMAYGLNGDYEKGIEALNRATRLKPDDEEAFVSLGFVYYLQKEYAKSLEPLQQALRLDPSISGAHYYLGLSQLMLGHKTEALAQYEELKKMQSPLSFWARSTSSDLARLEYWISGLN